MPVRHIPTWYNDINAKPQTQYCRLDTDTYVWNLSGQGISSYCSFDPTLSDSLVDQLSHFMFMLTMAKTEIVSK